MTSLPCGVSAALAQEKTVNLKPSHWVRASHPLHHRCRLVMPIGFPIIALWLPSQV